jgi:hypothetical protein
LILMCKALHGVDSECPQDFEPTIGNISEWVSYRRVLPVDDGNKLSISP